MNSPCRSCGNNLQTIHQVWSELFEKISIYSNWFLHKTDQENECDQHLQVHPQPEPQLPPDPQQEKFLFVVRHAQSQWNQLLQGKTNLGDGAACLAKTDHQLTEAGIDQAIRLRNEIRQSYNETNTNASGSSDCSRSAWYDQLFRKSMPIYCSPMLRALQTAHIAIPVIEGWAERIVLLPDAREVFQRAVDRDCVGSATGRGIIRRAVSLCDLPVLAGLDERVDTSECDGEWWSKQVEGAEQIQARLRALMDRLLNFDDRSSCVLVTHSILIRELVRQYGAGDRNSDGGYYVWCAKQRNMKLKNCGVLGLRCRLVDHKWVIVDACPMFCSDVFVES
eukprot:gnl/MRDRNA2_/MRDRNA2_56557_c0_seq3.p1 gnl/MRDRNA2_/MRDRNA2_56557_c0~~gnl/MRDRNA2_/MRDRNA2_56557_c0_seq3.p1  ORF type:complete len:336 (-),score=44.90 gnl/MRDRNA2_/MRDRNA2_56557_c0_seq3:18-1025(-)